MSRVTKSMWKESHFFWSDYWAVSYTHLDVYKRQGNMKTYCLLFDQKGTGKELTIDLPPLSSGSGNSNRISDVHFAPDGGLYIVDVNQTIYQIDRCV